MKPLLAALLSLFMLACEVDSGSVAVLGTGDATLDAIFSVQDVQEKLQDLQEEIEESPQLTERDAAVAEVLKHLKHLLGTEYVYGVTDCSWLIREAFRRAGYPVKHLSSRAMYDQWFKTETPGIGDLFYFDGHIGFSLVDTAITPREDWCMCHNGSSTGVENRCLATQGGYWDKRFVCGLIATPLLGLSTKKLYKVEE